MTRSILTDICQRLIGEVEFDVSYLDELNKGQLAVLRHNDNVYYIFLFQLKESRNACFQSFPTAFLKSINVHNSVGIFCYFLPLLQEQISKIETDYFHFMYRLMKTVGTEFINENLLSKSIIPYNSVEDIILGKNFIRGMNRANKSTYITLSADEIVQVYGKLYGANKYETVLLCFALYNVTDKTIKVYEIEEGNLQKLPGPSREKLITLGVQIKTVDLTIERTYFEDDKESLRSPRFNYNLLETYGDKKCALCNCSIPQIIQGAHIYPVAKIKEEDHLSLDDKLVLALDGFNGLWLCNNHHKLFDSNIIKISAEGVIKYNTFLNQAQIFFLRSITTENKLADDILHENLIWYIEKRNNTIVDRNYLELYTIEEQGLTSNL